MNFDSSTLAQAYERLATKSIYEILVDNEVALLRLRKSTKQDLDDVERLIRAGASGTALELKRGVLEQIKRIDNSLEEIERLKGMSI